MTLTTNFSILIGQIMPRVTLPVTDLWGGGEGHAAFGQNLFIFMQFVEKLVK